MKIWPKQFTATDIDNKELTFVLVTLPVHGTLGGILPRIIYTPETHYTGTDSFQFKASDGILDSNIASITITIHPSNRESTLYEKLKKEFDQATEIDLNIDTLIEYGESEYKKLKEEFDQAIKQDCLISIVE